MRTERGMVSKHSNSDTVECGRGNQWNDLWIAILKFMLDVRQLLHYREAEGRAVKNIF